MASASLVDKLIMAVSILIYDEKKLPAKNLFRAKQWYNGKTMANDSIEIIRERNEFYQRSYHKILSIIGLSILVLCLLGGFIKLKISSQLLPRYFPTTPDGKVINSPPLTENHLLLSNYKFNEQDELIDWPEVQKKFLDLSAEDSNENAIVLFWAKKAVVGMFDFDFINYRNTLLNLRDYFTAQGYERFLSAFKASKNLDAVKDGQRVAYAVISGPAKVTDSSLLNNRKVWQVEMPVLVTYECPNEEPLKQNLHAIVKITRVSTLRNRFYGLAIYQINFKNV